MSVNGGTYCDQIQPAQDEDEDARRDDYAPELQAERLLTGSFFVEVAKHVDAEDDHCES